MKLLKNLKQVFIFTLLLSLIGTVNCYALSINTNDILEQKCFTENYEIGVKTFNIVDKSRLDPFSEAKKNRELMLKIWYPAQRGSSENFVNYWFHSDKAPNCVPTIPNNEFLNSMKSRTRLNPKVSKTFIPFPVVIYSHGYGSGMEFNQTLFEDLASKGYVVVSIGHTYEASISTLMTGEQILIDEAKRYGELCEGMPMEDLIKQLDDLNKVPLNSSSEQKVYDVLNQCIGSKKHLNLWCDDTTFVLNELKNFNNNRGNDFYNKLDLDKVGLIGFSFGGAKSFQYASQNENIKCAVNLDGANFFLNKNSKFNKPLLMMLSDNKFIKDFEIIFNKNENDTFKVKVDGATHNNYHDASVFFKDRKEDFALGTVDGNRMLQITNKSTLAFFDKYLKGSPFQAFTKNPLEFLKSYPEAKVEVKLKQK